MIGGNTGLWLLVIGITCVSGYFDGQGFLNASRIWQNGTLVPGALLRSAAGFATGISLYYVGLRFQAQLGIRSAEVQTLTWFGVTLISMALFSGQLWEWRRVDQAVAVLVLVGIGWLLVRTGG